MDNTLYVVGTPIGNLSDMSPRAVDTLRNVDFISLIFFFKLLISFSYVFITSIKLFSILQRQILVLSLRGETYGVIVIYFQYI